MRNLDELVNTLMHLKYKDKGDRYEYDVISSRHKPNIEKAVYKWANDQEDMNSMLQRIAELEAKVKAYESIIANSNFAMATTQSAAKMNQILFEFKDIRSAISNIDNKLDSMAAVHASISFREDDTK